MYLELLKKVVYGDYMGLTRTWLYSSSWYLVHTRIFMFYNKIGCKITRHGPNMGELIVKTEQVHLEYLYLCTRYDGVYFTWCISLCNMGY